MLRNWLGVSPLVSLYIECGGDPFRNKFHSFYKKYVQKDILIYFEKLKTFLVFKIHCMVKVPK